MNRERAKELLPIIQAFAEGKMIERFGTETGQAQWEITDNLVFVEGVMYRIKPEPMEIWVNYREDGISQAFGSYESAKANINYKCETRHFREVTE